MAIHFTCPYCTRPMKSPERFVGRQVICPACKAELIVPQKTSERPAVLDRPPEHRAERAVMDILQSLIRKNDSENKVEAARYEREGADV